MTPGTEGGRGKKREKQIKRLKETRVTGRVGTLGGLDTPGCGPGKRLGGVLRSLWEQTQAQWPAWFSFLSGFSSILRGQEGPTLAGPPSQLPAAPGVSELLPFKVGHDSAVLGPRAAWPLRLLQALLGQLGQVLL